MKRVIFLGFITGLLCLTACGEASPGKQLKVSGHRGASGIAPENTLASLDSCIKYGIDYMECDVRISKDSVFYLLHDSTLDRTTNGTGLLREWLSKDIDTLDAGSWFGEEFKGMRVPRLADVLRKAKRNNVNITIDYRSGEWCKMMSLIRAEGMEDRCAFTFWDENDVKAFRAFAPEVKTLQAYIKNKAELDEVVNRLKPNIAVIRMDSLTRELVKACHQHKLEVLALSLGKENAESDARKAIEMGADILAIDCPEKIVKKFRKR